MKKYTIKDSQGNKEIIYAKSIVDAMSFVDSKMKDSFNLIPGDVYVEKWDAYTVTDAIYKILKIDDNQSRYHRPFNSVNTVNATVEEYYYDFNDGTIQKGNVITTTIHKNNITAVFPSMQQAIKYLKHKQKLYRPTFVEHKERYLNSIDSKTRDSNFRDSLNEAKNLVASAGFKVLRAYGSDDEPYITVKWDGSYSELDRKVRALKSKARKIGYKDVYTDDNDICFSRY